MGMGWFSEKFFIWKLAKNYFKLIEKIFFKFWSTQELLKINELVRRSSTTIL